MSSFEGTSAIALDAMRATLARMKGGRLLSSATRPINTSPPLRVWQPSHGIVFGGKLASSIPGSTRSLSAAAIDEQDHILQIHEEEDSVMECSEIEVTSTRVLNSTEGRPADDDLNELPQSTTEYQMSEEIFRQAKNAVQGSLESFWTHTLYRGPLKDGIEQKVKVHYCKSKHTTERTLQYFLGKKIMGFDMEWKADSTRHQGAKKNASLIQLATEERIILIHVALFPKDELSDLVAPTLKTIMEDPTITKVGVAIKADCTRLRKYLGIDAKGTFELSHLYKLVKFSHSKNFKQINKRLVSLSTQVQEHLHLPMNKGDVRSSDWSLPLQMEQIVYAAADSYAGIHLYDTLEIKRKALDPTPPRPFHAEENRPIRLAEGVEIPTDDPGEELEPDDSEPNAVGRTTYPKFSSSYLASVTENLELDPDFDISTPPISSSSTSTIPVSKPKNGKSPLTTTVTRPKSPVVLSAESLAQDYRQSNPKTRATPSSLRAYFIWHCNPTLSIPEIAALLRDIPLQNTTVVNYILEAVKVEKLPFQKERLRTVLAVLPKEVVGGRYRALAKACEVPTADESS